MHGRHKALKAVRLEAKKTAEVMNDAKREALPAASAATATYSRLVTHRLLGGGG